MTRGSEMKGAVYYGKKKQILGFCSSRSSGGSSSRSSCGNGTEEKKSQRF